MAARFPEEERIMECQEETPTPEQCKTCQPLLCALMVRVLYNHNKVKSYLETFNTNYIEIRPGTYQLYYDCKKCPYRIIDKTLLSWDGSNLKLQPHLGAGLVDIGRNCTTYKIRMHSRKCGSKNLPYSGPTGTRRTTSPDNSGTLRGDTPGFPSEMEWTVLTRPHTYTSDHRKPLEDDPASGASSSEVVVECEDDPLAETSIETGLSTIDPSDWTWDSDFETFLQHLSN